MSLDSDSPRVAVSHCTLRGSAGYGFEWGSSTVVMAFDHNTVTQNSAGAGWVTLDTLGALDATSAYTGNGKDVIYVASADTVADQTWQALGVPYLLDGTMNIYNNITIAPGAQLVFRQNAGLVVQENASLTAVGTAGAPILFTASDKTPGYCLRFP